MQPKPMWFDGCTQSFPLVIGSLRIDVDDMSSLSELNNVLIVYQLCDVFVSNREAQGSEEPEVIVESQALW